MRCRSDYFGYAQYKLRGGIFIQTGIIVTSKEISHFVRDDNSVKIEMFCINNIY